MRRHRLQDVRAARPSRGVGPRSARALLALLAVLAAPCTACPVRIEWLLQLPLERLLQLHVSAGRSATLTTCARAVGPRHPHDGGAR